MRSAALFSAVRVVRSVSSLAVPASRVANVTPAHGTSLGYHVSKRHYTEHAVKSSNSSMMHHHGAFGHDEETYYPSSRQKNGAHVNGLDDYMRLYQESIVKPEKFWRRMCEDFYWEKPWHTLNDVNFEMAEREYWDKCGAELACDFFKKKLFGRKEDADYFIWCVHGGRGEL